jgi:hypothetical protein
MTAAPAGHASGLRGRISRSVETEPCACTPDRLCLWHYGQLDFRRQTRERVRAGVHEPYSSRR